MVGRKVRIPPKISDAIPLPGMGMRDRIPFAMPRQSTVTSRESSPWRSIQ